MIHRWSVCVPARRSRCRNDGDGAQHRPSTTPASRGWPRSPGTNGSPGIRIAGCCRCSARRCWRCPARCSPDALDKVKSAKGVASDVDLDVDDLQGLWSPRFRRGARTPGQEFPQHPREQLDMAINACSTPGTLGGSAVPAPGADPAAPRHRGEHLHDGVRQPRRHQRHRRRLHPRPGDRRASLPTATTSPTRRARTSSPASATRSTLDDLKALDPTSHKQLMKVMRRLETHYRDLCDIEFTIERGKLWMLQTRVGKRTRRGGVPDRRATGRREPDHRGRSPVPVSGSQLALLMFPQFDRSATRDLLTRGMAASPGAAVGHVVSIGDCQARAERGDRVVLVRRETNPDDPRRHDRGRRHPDGARWQTSHAAVVARGMGKTCVCGQRRSTSTRRPGRRGSARC